MSAVSNPDAADISFRPSRCVASTAASAGRAPWNGKQEPRHRRARRIVTVSWTGWSDSCEAALYRTADGRFVRFRVDGKTELSQTYTEKQWQEERPWRVLAAFFASDSNARCPGPYISGISVKGVAGLEAGLLLLAAADTSEDGDGRPVLDAFDGLPTQVLEAIWREEGPWVKDGYYTAAPIFDAIQEFWSLASEAGHDTIADCAGNFGIPLEGNVLRSVLDALRAEQTEEEASLNEHLEERRTRTRRSSTSKTSRSRRRSHPPPRPATRHQRPPSRRRAPSGWIPTGTGIWRRPARPRRRERPWWRQPLSRTRVSGAPRPTGCTPPPTAPSPTNSGSSSTCSPAVSPAAESSNRTRLSRPRALQTSCCGRCGTRATRRRYPSLASPGPVCCPRSGSTRSTRAC